MKSKYEISVWEDVPSDDGLSFKEEKIIIIGSNTMTSESRAREPKMINNINGTNKFSFNMYYSYIDTRTGEKVYNPYIKYLVNERKIKVLWKDEWYDLLIKQIKEDQVNHVFTYTCEDAYITELSRTGFELTFATELENNIGTAPELIEQTLKGTDWSIDSECMEKIYQQTEEAVYETITLSDFHALKDVDGEQVNIDTLINSNKPILIYYSYASNINNLKEHLQFYYADGDFTTDINEMLVNNGTSYTIDVIWRINENNNEATAEKDGVDLFTIYFNQGISKEHRAERYVQSQQTKYIDILDRYVNVYTDENNNVIYGYQKTEYNDALAVVNLFTNPSNFVNVSGWVGNNLFFKLSPGFNSETVVKDYTATSFLHLDKGNYYNMGIQHNRAYTPDGYIPGDKYILRFKARFADIEEPIEGTPITVENNVIIPSIQGRDSNYNPQGPQYFLVGAPSNVIDSSDNETWVEFPLICDKACPYDEILSSDTPFGLFLATSMPVWIKEVQFFHEVYGEGGVRIEPGKMSTQSVAQVVWKYFTEEALVGATATTLKYKWTSLEPWAAAIPVANNYERYGTIEADDSNRFNILQTIAESFKCWVRFRVGHDQETGYITYHQEQLDDETSPLIPDKYVYLTRETGQETGIGFVYGIDLKSIVRTIKSDKISTKTIVAQNENQFGKNGFCTIARSEENYIQDNFILNFDYYIQHQLLNRDELYKDLYGGDLNYYNELHRLNSTYIDNLEKLNNKKLELTKQEAMLTVYEQYKSAAIQELESVEEDLMKLASVDNIEDALKYAKSHANFTKVQSLINDRTTIETTITTYENLFNTLQTSVESLNSFIDTTQKEQDTIIENLKDLNGRFFKKYSRYIQEGTWTSEDYWDDTLYYLDALQVAYTSSRPQIQYEINVLRLSDIPEYSSKVFNLGDISFVQDVEYFGYIDKFTPYKEKVILSEITSYFDTPDKDTIKVQNYKTQFDDLFQRITAAVQNLEFTEGKYAKAASIVNSDGTIRSNVIQNTFAENVDLVYGAQNESATIDNTGVTVTNNADGSKQVKVTSGGVFITSDGGMTWNNAIRGDGITADVITTGRLNTEQVVIYGADAPSFTWDQYGINAYTLNTTTGATDYNQFVRFDKYGLYGIRGLTSDFHPTSEADIYDKANFGLTWNRFFLRNGTSGTGVEISTDKDIVVTQDRLQRIVIGRVDPDDQSNYGIIIRNKDDNTGEPFEVFRCDKKGSFLSGWELNEDYLTSQASSDNQAIKIYANGNIGCYGKDASTEEEYAYITTVTQTFFAKNLEETDSSKQDESIPYLSTIYPFVSSLGRIKTQRQVEGADNEIYHTPTEAYVPSPPSVIYFAYGTPLKNYKVQVNNWTWHLEKCTAETYSEGNIPIYTTYTYEFQFTAYIDDIAIFTVPNYNQGTPIMTNYKIARFIPAADTKWCIDNNGDAIFHNITADGGQIAGWWIDNQSIYQTYDGTSNRTRIVSGQEVSNIKTELSSTGTAVKDNFDYSIVTDAINASMASVGGMLMQSGTINGYNIARVAAAAAQAAQAAAAAAQSAEAAMARANYAAQQAGEAYNWARNHIHGYLGIEVGARNTTGTPQLV